MRDQAGVPVVSVVIKGGYRTALLIQERLSGNDSVILLAKSGGVASLIFRLMEHIKLVRLDMLV